MNGETASTLAWKLGGALLGFGIVASAIGFMVLWPKTVKEGVARIGTTILGSAVFGPAAAIAAYQKWPELFNAAVTMATKAGLDPIYGWISAGAPFMVLAGLPVWWIGGAIALWFERRKDKDIAELAQDAKRSIAGGTP
jgi:hypothetical protein